MTREKNLKLEAGIFVEKVSGSFEVSTSKLPEVIDREIVRHRQVVEIFVCARIANGETRRIYIYIYTYIF